MGATVLVVLSTLTGPKANFDAWPKVEEVAATIHFLASPENKVTRGGVVPVYGASSQSAAS